MPRNSHSTWWKPGSPSPNPSGRPRGAGNKIAAEAKQIILGAATILGGAEALADWVKSSPRNAEIFYRDILPRTLPKIIDAKMDTAPPLRELHHYLVSPAGTVVDESGREVLDEDGRVIGDPVYLALHDLPNGESEH